MSERGMTVKLKVWRQAQGEKKGRLVEYSVPDVSTEMSFLEMLDMLNRSLTLQGEEPVAFDNDCREGICGTCSLVINGKAHGRENGTTVCQLHMRHFKEGQTIVIEPWRARAFPVIKDLIVDRSALDKIITSGGYISVGTGAAPDANSLPIGKVESDLSFDAAACIGCGACVAACPNASAMLFVSAKISQFALLPQGQPERYRRAARMVAAMDEAKFGACTNIGECEAACPKEISVSNIARLNRDYLKAAFLHDV